MIDTTNIATLLTPQALRENVVSALVDGRIFRRFARGDDQPEDLAVDLLREPDSGAVRNSVLAGVRDVWLVLQEALVQPDCNPDAPARKGSLPLGEIVSHFGALLNRAAPKELEALPYSLLEIVLRPDADRVLYGPLVRAALAYAHSERRAPFWESQAADELVPGWAFKALAQIDAEHPRILRLLVLRWTKALAQDTAIDPILITDEIAMKRKDPIAFRQEVWRSVAPAASALGQKERFIEKWGRVAKQADEKDERTANIVGTSFAVPMVFKPNPFDLGKQFDETPTKVGLPRDQNALIALQSSLTRISRSDVFSIESVSTEDGAQIVQATAYVTELFKAYRLLFVEYQYSNTVDALIQTVLDRTTANLTSQIGDFQQPRLKKQA